MKPLTADDEVSVRGTGVATCSRRFLNSWPAAAMASSFATVLSCASTNTNRRVATLAISAGKAGQSGNGSVGVLSSQGRYWGDSTVIIMHKG